MDHFQKLFSVTVYTEDDKSIEFVVIAVKREIKVGDITLQFCDFSPLTIAQSEILFSCMLSTKIVDLIVDYSSQEQTIYVLSAHGVVDFEGRGVVAEMKGLVLEGIFSGAFSPQEIRVSHRDQLKQNDMLIAVTKPRVH